LSFGRSIGGKLYKGIANGYSDLMLSRFEYNLSDKDIEAQEENFSKLGYDYLLD
jgi:hypothetical protein